MIQPYKYLRQILPLILILVLFFSLRFQNLTSLPVFGDEAIYLRWSQLIKNVETLRFVPLTDGKQPLFMWLTAGMYKVVSDPLVAGRTVSIFAGSLTVVSLYAIGLIFFTPVLASIAAFLYTIIPFAFFFDRMALADSLLSAFGTMSLLFSLLLARYRRLDLAMILGAVLGVAWLTKSPAIYFIVLAFVTYLIYSKSNLKTFYLPLLSAAISFVIYNILRLGPQFHMIALRNRDYVWGFGDLLKTPLDPLIPHIYDIITIYSSYISVPLILVFLVGLNFKKIRLGSAYVIVFLWWLLPLLATASIAKVFTARYIFFTLPPLIILLAFSIENITKRLSLLQSKKYLLFLAVFLFLIIPVKTIYSLSADPFNYKAPSTEAGYFSDWTSGWGIKPFSDYLISRSHEANVIVGTEGFFGTLPDGVQIYSDQIPRLTVFGVGIDLTSIPEKLIDARNHGDEVYMLFNQNRLKLTPDHSSKVSLVKSFNKPDGDKLVLLRLN